MVTTATRPWSPGGNGSTDGPKTRETGGRRSNGRGNSPRRTALMNRRSLGERGCDVACPDHDVEVLPHPEYVECHVERARGPGTVRGCHRIASCSQYASRRVLRQEAKVRALPGPFAGRHVRSRTAVTPAGRLALWPQPLEYARVDGCKTGQKEELPFPGLPARATPSGRPISRRRRRRAAAARCRRVRRRCQCAP